MSKTLFVLMLVTLAAGCVSTPAKRITVSFELDRYGAAYPVVDGEAYPMTAEERRQQVQLIVNEYCKPAE